MVKRILTWDPPLWVTALILFGIALAVPFAMDGGFSPVTFVIAAACFGAQASRKRRLAAERAASRPTG